MSATYAVNASTLAASQYDIPDAVDVVEHAGELLFLTATGLQSLDAPSTAGAGVFGTVTTGEIAISDADSTSINFSTIDIVADGDMHMTATAHQDGADRAATYLLPLRDGAHSRHRRVKIGNGMAGNAWSFTLSPPAAAVCNWGLSSWKVEPGQIRVRRR